VAVNEQQARPKLTLERSLKASVGAVWELWTTSAGIESWWGPDGFEVKVRTLDLRPQGELRYSMKAVGADQIDTCATSQNSLVKDKPEGRYSAGASD